MKKVAPPLFGSKLHELLTDSLITLNVHGHVNANYGKAKFAAVTLDCSKQRVLVVVY